MPLPGAAPLPFAARAGSKAWWSSPRVDLVDSLVYPGPYYLKLTLQVVEEGGELFVVSIALMLMAVAARCPRRIVGLA